jgi:hypothetical protein
VAHGSLEILKLNRIIHDPARLLILTFLYPVPKLGHSFGATLPAMFCPQCRVEYRPGFTRCTDCDVDLEHELPLARTESFESRQDTPPGENEEDPFCSFWKGDDSRLHAELCSVLDEAGIPHKTVRRQDHLFNLNNYPAFQIGIPFSSFEKAEAAVKDAYGVDGSDPDAVRSLTSPAFIADRSKIIQKFPNMPTPAEEENIPGPPDAGEDAEEEFGGHGIEVWSGDDSSLGDMLVASLRENKIGVRRKKSNSKESLLVSSREETRAREVVKEVVEGVPPE